MHQDQVLTALCVTVSVTLTCISIQSQPENKVLLLLEVGITRFQFKTDLVLLPH